MKAFSGTVADALHGRDHLTDEAFGRRYFASDLAIEFQLSPDCPWPDRFGSLDALVRFVAEHAHALKIN